MMMAVNRLQDKTIRVFITYKCKLYMRKDDDPPIMKSNEGRVNVIRAQMNKHGK